MQHCCPTGRCFLRCVKRSAVRMRHGVHRAEGVFQKGRKTPPEVSRASLGKNIVVLVVMLFLFFAPLCSVVGQAV